MQRSQSSAFEMTQLIQLSISPDKGHRSDARRQLTVARTVLGAVWPNHQELLVRCGRVLMIVIRTSRSMEGGVHPSDIDHFNLNDDLHLRTRFISETDLTGLRSDSYKGSLSIHSANTGSNLVVDTPPSHSTSKSFEDIPSTKSPFAQAPRPSNPVTASRFQPQPPISQRDLPAPTPLTPKISDHRSNKSSKPVKNPPNKILHICNIDHDFQSAREIANFLTIYGLIKEMIFLTNQGKVFVHFHRQQDATRAMEDINRFERPNLAFLRANYSHLTKLSFDFKVEHRNSRQFNDMLREVDIPQRPVDVLGSPQSLSKSVEVTLELSESQLQLKEAAALKVSEWLKNNLSVVAKNKDKHRLRVDLPSELAAIKVVSKLHCQMIEGVKCFANFVFNGSE